MGEQQANQQSISTTGKAHLTIKPAYIAALLTGIGAFGLVYLLWVSNPSYAILFHNLDASIFPQVSAELQKNNIVYQYDSSSGNVLVPEQSLYHARFALASQGLAQSSMPGLTAGDALRASSRQDNQSGSVGLQRIPTQYFSLETELAKTIASIDNILWARVHLSIVKADSSKQNSEASVVVRLEKGRRLGEQQLAAISHLIAASTVNLSAENVTIIDQSGNLLKSTGNKLTATGKAVQYGYARLVEQSYIEKIEATLVPVFGEKAIRVSIDANIEMVDEDESGANLSQPMDNQKHIIKKLSATIIVDNKLVNNEEGQLVSVPRSKNSLEKIKHMVKESIEFDESRGDSVNVINESFGPLLQPVGQRADIEAEKNGLYYLKMFFLVLVGLTVAYYLIRLLIYKIMQMKPMLIAPDVGSTDLSLSVNTTNNTGDGSEGPVNVASTYEALLTKTRQLVNDDPEHIANILKIWVRDNGR